MAKKGEHIGKPARPAKDRLMEKVSNIGDCWIWTGGKNHNGYGTFGMFRDDGKWVTELAHRASYRIFVGEIPEGMLVLHNCDNRACINPAHLYIGTQKQNMLDMIVRNRQGNTGENHPRAKLTWGDIDYIRSCGYTCASLSHKFGVSETAIQDIKKYHTWTTKLDKPNTNQSADVPKWNDKPKSEIDKINAEVFESSVDRSGECWI